MSLNVNGNFLYSATGGENLVKINLDTFEAEPLHVFWVSEKNPGRLYYKRRRLTHRPKRDPLRGLPGRYRAFLDSLGLKALKPVDAKKLLYVHRGDRDEAPQPEP